MGVNYVERGYGLHEAVRAAGHRLEHVNGIWISDDDAAVQAIIDVYDPVPYAKRKKIVELGNEALRRVSLVFEEVNTREELEVIAHTILSITPAARQLTSKMQSLMNHMTVLRAGVATINGYTLLSDVQAFNVVTTPVWP